MTSEGVLDPSTGGPVSVLCVDAGDGDVAETLATVEGFSVRCVRPDRATEGLGDTGVDCVVVDADPVDDATALVERVEGRGVPVVARATDPVVAEAVLEAGARAVHASRGAPKLLGRRISRAVRSETSDGSLRHALDRVDDGVVVLDEEWVCTYANERARAVFSTEGDPIEGEVMWDVLGDAQGRPFYNAAKRALEEGDPVTVKERFDGVGEWIELRIFPSESGVTIYLQDVTERKRRDERLGRLLMTTRALMAAESRRDVSTTVASAVRKVLGFDYGRVYLGGDDGSALEPIATTDDTGVGHLDQSLVEDAFQRGSPVVRDDLDPGEGAPGSCLVLPLEDHGVLAVAAVETGAFTQSDIAVGEILTANAVAALDRADRQETLERYEDVLETVQGMVYALDDEGQFTLVTDPLANRLGYDREELKGRHVSAILDDAGLEAGNDVIQELVSTDRESYTYETEMYTAGGDVVPIEVEISLLPSSERFRGTVGAVRDRTELERARAALETERDRFTYLFENLPDPVAELEYVEEDPVVRNVNRAFVETFEVEAEGIIGDSLNDHVFPHAETEVDDDLDSRLADGEFVTRELRRETADGIGDFLLRGIPYLTEGGTTRVFALYTDITDQKRRQRRLGVLNRVLRHNVRNEMTIIRGYSRMIADRLVGEGTDRDLAEAAVELAESAATIEDLSTEARRVEKVLKEEHDGEVDVSSIAEAVLEESQEEFPDARLVLDAPEPVPVATTDRIRLAIEHLVENAVEHNETGTPTVRVSTTTTENGRAAIRVEDNGPGIPDYERGVVTGAREVTQLEHGSGLGLWIVKWTVEGFGGHVRFSESELGGATVDIRLPRPEEPDRLPAEEV
jgi:PAS domain S-box-containing protein